MLCSLIDVLPQQYRSIVEELYIENKDVTMCVALGIVKDKHLAQDIVHHAFVNIIKHIERIETLPKNEQKGYVICIVKNLAIDHLRKKQRESIVSYDHVEATVSDNISTESIVMAGLEVGLVKKKLQEMDEKYALPLILKYTLGMTQAEIAQVLDISVGNVKARCHRARKKLIEAMGKGVPNE